MFIRHFSQPFLSRRHTSTLFLALVGVIFLIFPALASDHADRCSVEGPDFKALKVADDAEQPAPFKFTRADGSTVSLADFTGRGVIVNFWATWCAPCVREMPELDALKKELAPDGIDVLALSMDRGAHNAIAEFYDRYKIANLDALHVTSAEARAISIRGLPTTLLIDAEGREVARIVGLHKYDTPESIAYFKRCIGPAQ